jgi:hypothetical protein
VVLRDTAVLVALRLQGFHLLWLRFPGGFDFSFQITLCGPYNPDEA